MVNLLILALVAPLMTAILSLLQTRTVGLRLVNLIGSVFSSSLLVNIIYVIWADGSFHSGLFYVDHVSAVFLIVVAMLGVTAVLVSISYMEKELEHNRINFVMLRRYYALLHIFIFTMIGLLIVENMGLMWVAVEATTLASAFLVAFYFTRPAIEAAWKYVMVCTVGICLALLGTILLYYAQVNALGESGQALSWLLLRDNSMALEPSVVKLSFIFILIGYGTKAGLAPMHTWLPDAHSQAPSPVSGLLSGALLSCALYALLRSFIIVQGTVYGPFFHLLLIAFGLGSIVIALPFILVQSDLKRLLAYSSVEHMGIITLGLGIGTPLAIYGALLHVLNHAVAKSTLFYLAGIVIQEYKSKHIMRIRNMIRCMPAVGTAFVISVFGITGMPPFSLFTSKFIIAWSAFANDYWLVGVLALLLLAGIFAGMMFYCLRMVFGSGTEHPMITDSSAGLYAKVAIFVSVACMVVTGLYLPPWLNLILSKAASTIIGG